MQRLLFLFLFIATTAFAQNLQCGSVVEPTEEFMNSHEYHVMAQDYLDLLKKHQAKTSAGEPTRIIFPTVVHVIHTGQGNADSISQEQVESMFELLHMQLRQVPGTPYYGGLGADMYMDFELARVDESGNPTTGIDYVYSPQYSDLNQGTENAQVKALSYWDPEKYFNIWVCKSIVSGSGQGLGGYGQFPPSATLGSPPPNYALTDGIVVLHSTVGRIGTAQSPYESTVVHEIGHWIGLYHPFQGGCFTGVCSTTGDWVCDLPQSVNSDFKNPNARLNSCSGENPEAADLPRDYMEYTQPDIQQSFFTNGQKNRARAFMTNSFEERRFNLWQDENHRATGVGKYGALEAYFWADNTNTFINQPVTFKDYSRNIPTSYSWVFEGNPTVDLTDPAAPIARWDTPGTYDVTLTVGNDTTGLSDTTLVDFITVYDTKVTLPVNETFSNFTFPPANWLLENPDAIKNSTAVGGSVTWVRSAASGTGSEGAIRLTNGANKDIGQKEYIRLPYLDLRNITNAKMSFSVAYQPIRYVDTQASIPSFGMVYTDTLVVEGSLDGGATWTEVYRKGGEDLMTTASVLQTSDANELGNTIVQGASNFRTDTLCFPPAWVGDSLVQVRFKAINGFGGNILLDDIKVEDAACIFTSRGAAGSYANYFISVFPNPAQHSATLRVESNKSLAISTVVRDLQGRIVLDAGTLKAQRGLNEYKLDVASLPSGVYVVQTVVDGKTVMKKLIKY